MELKVRCYLLAFVALGVFPLEAQTGSRAGSRGGDFVVYARELWIADVAVMEAERIQQRFFQCFGLEDRRSRIPIVLLLGNPTREPRVEDGALQVLTNGSDAKIQVSWDVLPISADSFTRGWVRALGTRLATERFLSKIEEGSASEGERLRFPIWVAEGMAGMLMESFLEQEIAGRGTLMARTKPQLSLNQTLAELDGRSELNPEQRALATVLCRALTQTPGARHRFLERLSWDSGLMPRDWIQSILENENADAWWKDVWERQANQTSWVKLSFPRTLRWVNEWERISSSALEKRKAYEIEIGAVGHPWFRRWLIKCASSGEDDSDVEIVRFRKDIQLRREAALEWFAALHVPELKWTRFDWIAWSRLHRDFEKMARGSGPVASWFNDLANSRDRSKS